MVVAAHPASDRVQYRRDYPSEEQNTEQTPSSPPKKNNVTTHETELKRRNLLCALVHALCRASVQLTVAECRRVPG